MTRDAFKAQFKNAEYGNAVLLSMFVRTDAYKGVGDECLEAGLQVRNTIISTFYHTHFRQWSWGRVMSPNLRIALLRMW